MWDAACSIRGAVDAPKFKDYILPLIFVKRISDVFEDEIKRLSDEFGDEKVVEGSEKRLVDRLAEGLVERLAESQKRILILIKENPYISKKELSKTIGISTTAIDKNITRLKKEGLLRRIGPDKGGYWEVVKK